jgi:hypothetical protein
MSRPLAAAVASAVLSLLAACSSGGSKTETAATCRGASVACGDLCVDVRSDNRNCGACGNVCGGGDVCVAGACSVHPAITSFTGPLAFTAGRAGLTLVAAFTNGTASVAGCTPTSAAASPATFTCPALSADTTFTLAVASSVLAGVVDTASLTVVAAPDPVLAASLTGPPAPLAPGGVATLSGTGCAGCTVRFSPAVVVDTGSTTGAFTGHLATAPSATTSVTMSVVNAAGDGALVSAGVQVVEPAVVSFTGPAVVTSGGDAVLTAAYTPPSASATVAGCAGGAVTGTAPATRTFTCPALTTTTDFDVAVAYGTAVAHAAAPVHVAVVAAPVASAFVASPAAVTAGDAGPVTFTATLGPSVTSATISGSDGSGPLPVTSGVPARLPGPSGASAGSTVTYTLTLANAAGAVDTSHTAAVQVVAAPSIQSGGLQASPSALTVGDAGTVTFTAPTFASAGGAFAGAVLSGAPSSGAAAIPNGGTNVTYVRAQDFPAAGSYLFTVTASNGATTPATTAATTTIRVYDPPAVASGTVSASPSAVTSGGSATLTAPVFGPSVTSAFLSTQASGATSGAAIPSGGQVVFSNLVAPTTTWYLYVVNAAGRIVQAPGQSATVVVPPPPTWFGTFTASPASVPLASAGTITFTVPIFGAGVTAATITGGGASVAATSGGTPSLPAPQATTTYTLTASNAAGQTVSQTASVLVAEGLPGPDMPRARYGAATLVLPGGKILVAGGSTTADVQGNALSTAVIYDPATGAFGLEMTMVLPRYRPTATLVTGGANSGKVLIAGGTDLQTVELFDPVSSTFVAAGTLRQARCGGHAAFEVTPGTVAIAGGGDCGGNDLTQIEYWTGGGSNALGTPLTQPRRGLTATRLGNGKVLLAGGSASSGAFADLLTPNASPLSSTVVRVSTATGTARQFHTATLLADGTVLVAGGNPAVPGGTAEAYDPATNTFATTSNELNVSRASHTATLLPNGRVLLTGGTVSGGTTTKTAEWYDPATRRFGIAPNLATPRTQHLAAPAAGDVTLVAGGTDATGLTSPTEFVVSP